MYRFWTIVKIFLGKCQVSKHRSWKKLRTGRKSRQHISAVQPFIPVTRKFSSADGEQQARPLGGRLTARQAVARRNNEIIKGGAYDE
jgi:hypothetical protein